MSLNSSLRDDPEPNELGTPGAGIDAISNAAEPDAVNGSDSDADLVPPTPGEDPTSYRQAWARRAFDLGWSFTPTHGKKPYMTGWQSAPRPSLEEVQGWARSQNIAVRTGSASGVVVIDDDTEGQTAGVHLSLPPTLTVLTGRGGTHHYFRAPEQPLKNSTSRLAPGVDVKADGGAVVFVGSVHPDTGGAYRWVDGRSPDEVELADLPEPLLQRLLSLQQEREGGAPSGYPPRVKLRHRKYAEAALGNLFDEVAGAPVGTRNDTLNRAAFKMGSFIACGMIDREKVEDALTAAAKQAGLPAHEISATLRSGIESGEEQPFDLTKLDGEHAAAYDTARAPSDPPDAEDAGVPPQQAAHRPIILVEPGDLPRVVDEGEKALIATGDQGIYQRENMLVRIVRSRSTTIRPWGRSPAGSVSTIEVDPLFLVERFMNSAMWMRIDGRSGEQREIDCPQRIAKHYLARVGGWEVPPLHGVIEAPTLRPDGSVLSEPGYDARTGLYLYPTGMEFPPVPLEPSKDEAARALQRLWELIQEFPFVQKSDRAAALSAILTALVRRSLRTAPLIAFRAPKMASGKSLLADVVAMISTGRTAPVMTQGKGEEEDRKRMLALLLEGEPIACIDNIDRPLGGAVLCSVLTQEVWKDRILGKSAIVAAPTSTTWLATGNNLVFYGDITTRTIVSDLDAGCEHPEERAFDINLYEYVPRHRAALVVDGLTVLRAYQFAGLPDQGLPLFGRFEQWSDWIRSPLVWLGMDDPCGGRERIEDGDPVRVQLRSFLQAWYALFADEKKAVADVIREARPAQVEDGGALWDELVEVAGERGVPNAWKLGAWLAKHERRPEGGMRIERLGERSKVGIWRVRRV